MWPRRHRRGGHWYVTPAHRGPWAQHHGLKNATAALPPAAGAGGDIAGQLDRLFALHEKGALTAAE